jgi:hypothetical protein
MDSHIPQTTLLNTSQTTLLNTSPAGFGCIPSGVELALLGRNNEPIQKLLVPADLGIHGVYLKFECSGDIDPTDCKFQ